MTIAFQGIDAGLEHGNRNSGLDSKVYNKHVVWNIIIPQPPDYTFRDRLRDWSRSDDNLAAIHTHLSPPQPPDYTFRDRLRDWSRSDDNLAATRLSLTALGQKEPAPSFLPTPIMHLFPAKRLSGPIQFVLKLLDYWRLSRNDAVSLLGFNSTDSDSAKDILNGTAFFLDGDMRDRIAHLFHIWTTLSSLFQDRDVENDWLREPHALLDEQSPLNLLMDGDMENLLLVKEYVDAAAGH